MEILVSFCITVYNQSNHVKKCIDSIIPYRGNDIEIIISDDGSTEDIKGLIDNYGDNRIKYFRNEKNVGHDRNILNSLAVANGKYAFLLRSRDYIISDAIHDIIKTARTSAASYITGNALDQNGNLKLEYTRACYHRGSEALDAHFKLFIHPSGNMYRLSDVNTDELYHFLDDEKVPKTGFVVHNMIRIALALCGDFYLIQKPVWVYVDTEKSKDTAVNKAKNGMSVYDPELIKSRYHYEVKWISRLTVGAEYYRVFLLLTASYLDQITWGFKLVNSDLQNQRHYSFKKREFHVEKERKVFRKICSIYYSPQMYISKAEFERDLDLIFLKNKTTGFIKFIVRKMTIKTPFYSFFSLTYKKLIKRL